MTTGSSEMLPFCERRPLGNVERVALVVLAGAPLAWLAVSGSEVAGDGGPLVYVALFVPLGLLLLLFWSPFTPWWKHNEVTAERVRFGRWFTLEPHEIGDVELLDERTAVAAGMRLRHGNKKIAWVGSTIGWWGGCSGLLVERRHSGAKRPYWLVGTNRPDELAAALREARRAARVGGRT
jgi:hypothetical protein